MNAIVPLLVVAAFVIVACSSGSDPIAVRPAEATPRTASGSAAPRAPGSDRARIVTIGGSYMFGRTVARRDAWPSQLYRMLRTAVPMDVVTNLAEGGHNSQDVIDEQLDLVESHRPDLVLVQVGANDVITLTLAEYRANIEIVLERLLGILPAHRIAVVKVPDWSRTPRGRELTRELTRDSDIGQRFVDVNEALEELAGERGIAVIDISSVSERIDEDPSLLLPNEFDPSEKQYAGWVELIAPRVVEALAQPLP